MIRVGHFLRPKPRFSTALPPGQSREELHWPEAVEALGARGSYRAKGTEPATGFHEQKQDFKAQTAQRYGDFTMI